MLVDIMKGRLRAELAAWFAVAAVLLPFFGSARPRVSAQDPLPPAESLTLTVAPARSSVEWTLPATFHSVHGTFAIVRGAMQINSRDGTAGGEITASAASGDSGNEGRDRKMHREVLESARFPEISFRPSRLEGSLPPRDGTAQLQLAGTMTIHGAAHEMRLPVTFSRKGDAWDGSANFSVPYVAWGMKDPSTLFLHVRPAVAVEVHLAGAVSGK